MNRFAAAFLAALILAPAPGAAQPYPARPVKIVVPAQPGGGLDLIGRTVADQLGRALDQSFIVENSSGGGGSIAAQAVARAAPDGYTLLYATSSQLAQNPHTLASVPYDPFKDFTPISMATRGPLVLTVHSSLPVHSVKELVAWAKANPGKLNFASFGTGTSSHVYAAAFAKAAGIDVVHVPYKGTADAARDLLEGRVQAYFDAAPTAIQNAAGGRIRMIGVAAPKRYAAMPDVPTISEQGLPGNREPRRFNLPP
jgi:tripartite-type tricarboxylate transporter receptor subunit TctC